MLISLWLWWMGSKFTAGNGSRPGSGLGGLGGHRVCLLLRPLWRYSISEKGSMERRVVWASPEYSRGQWRSNRGCSLSLRGWTLLMPYYGGYVKAIESWAGCKKIDGRHKPGRWTHVTSHLFPPPDFADQIFNLPSKFLTSQSQDFLLLENNNVSSKCSCSTVGICFAKKQGRSNNWQFSKIDAPMNFDPQDDFSSKKILILSKRR